MKRLSIIFLFLLFSLPAMAGGGGFSGRFHPGVEWGMSLTPASFHHYNYLDESIGFRINDEGWDYNTKLGAFVLGSVAFDITRTFSVGLLSGWQGVERNRRIVPLISRLSFYLSGVDDDSIFVYTDLGLALNELKKKCNFIQIGSGYRLLLTPGYSLNLRVSGRIVYDRPEVWDPIEEEYISERNIKRNDAWYCALNLGFSLEF
jgi:hypothetical protein